MTTRTKVFLSSPMPTGNLEWEMIRDSVSALFNHGCLGSIFALEKIETEGGDTPDAIYLDQVESSQILLTIFAEEIRPGQRDEIEKALEFGIPVIAIQIERGAPNAETKDFIEGTLYNHRLVKRVKRHSELIDYVVSSLTGLVSRRIKQSRVEKIGISYAVKNDIFSDVGFEVIVEFCNYCFENHDIESAYKAINNLPSNDDRFFKLQMALAIISAEVISEENFARLDALSQNDVDTVYLIISMFFSIEDYSSADEYILKLKDVDIDSFKALDDVNHFMQTYSMHVDAEDVIDVWRGLQFIENISVMGMEIFTDYCELVWGLVTGANVDTSSFTPEVNCCLSCMPRDSGEWVILSPLEGDLFGLTLNILQHEEDGVPWNELNLEMGATCHGCGAELCDTDEVYKAFNDPESRDDDENNEVGG